MTVKTAAAIKAQFGQTDPDEHNTDLVDSLLDPGVLPAASATAKGVIEIAIDAEALAGTDTARAMTAANVRAVMGALKVITLDGVNGDGPCTAAGAVVGDVVLAVACLTGGALGSASASFEAVVTVEDQLQQTEDANLSANDYLAVLLAVV